MDPDANLREQLRLVRAIDALPEVDWWEINDDDRQEAYVCAKRLANLVGELDRWLLAGGFLPQRWRLSRK